MDNKKIQSLDDLIVYGKTSDFNVYDCVFLIKEEDVILIDSFAYEKYESIIRSRSQVIELTDEEWRLYMYKPELLSMALYNTPNLSHLILFLNGGSVFKFVNRPLTLLPASEIATTLQPILANESERLKRNKISVMS